jgi:hypothetical protein
MSGRSKVRAGTATDVVLKILNVPRDFPWLTMRDIIALGAPRNLSLNEVASALANLEPAGHIEVCRDRQPYRYRGTINADRTRPKPKPAFDNPYLHAFLVCAYEEDRPSDFLLRQRLVAEYAWAIPTESVIRALQKYEPICDLGCGTGYWAYLLSQAGARMLAVDPAPPLTGTNHWHHVKSCFGDLSMPSSSVIRHYHEIVEGSAETFDVPRNHALMLYWPPYDQPMAEVALSRYRGNCVIYVGEGSSGCTANDAFHATLEAAWSLVEYHDIPQWIGVHDGVYVYKRKGSHA